MGIAAAGNSGTVLANLLAPRLATAVGWHERVRPGAHPTRRSCSSCSGLMAKDAPVRAPPRTTREYLAAVAHPDTWWFCFFYSVTFGGYVGLSSFLPVFLRDQFSVSPIAAGSLTAAAALAGSLSRPLGGYLADRLGGVRGAAATAVRDRGGLRRAWRC